MTTATGWIYLVYQHTLEHAYDDEGKLSVVSAHATLAGANTSARRFFRDARDDFDPKNKAQVEEGARFDEAFGGEKYGASITYLLDGPDIHGIAISIQRMWITPDYGDETDDEGDDDAGTGDEAEDEETQVEEMTDVSDGDETRDEDLTDASDSDDTETETETERSHAP